MNEVAAALARHREAGTHRELLPRTTLHDYASNDYLGLANSQVVRAALLAELEAGCPLGATGSRLLSGQTPYHERVEAFLAEAFAAPSALLFGSGYGANLAVMGTLGSLDEVCVISDERNHASLIDGLRLSKAQRVIVGHNDLMHVEQALRTCTARVRVLVTESVFSMDGDVAPLAELLALAQRFDAWLIVDEAHATGVFGAHGLGCVTAAQHQWPKLIAIHTGGKALGGQGAFVLADPRVRELIINRGRSFIFSTALAPLGAVQLEHAVRAVLATPGQGAQLRQRAQRFVAGLPAPLRGGSQSQIVPIVLGSNAAAMAAMQRLRAQGYDVRAVRSPTVAPGTERLRLTLKSFHSDEVELGLQQALQALA